jgi:hypothetical protein
MKYLRRALRKPKLKGRRGEGVRHRRSLDLEAAFESQRGLEGFSFIRMD